MASELIRDPAKDHLLTPKNSALIIIDYQPVQVNSIASIDRQKLIDNIVGVAKVGRAFGLPIVHSTVNVKTGLNESPIPHLRKVLGDLPTVDRTSINAWEDVEFVQAVKATGRQKANNGSAMDGGLPDVSGARRAAGRLRGLRCC
jgi:nicotinamidase-related amidase